MQKVIQTSAKAVEVRRSFKITSSASAVVRVLIDQAQIEVGVTNLAQKVTRDFRDKQLLVVGVLTGSIVLLADLIRRIELPLQIGLIQASSYRGATTTSGKLEVNDAWLPELTGRDVLLVDDIFDTGQTLSGLLERIQGFQPRSVRSAVLLWKEGRQRVSMVPDYHCFRIPDEFVVGYGLDYNNAYRQLPYIAALEPADLEC